MNLTPNQRAILNAAKGELRATWWGFKIMSMEPPDCSKAALEWCVDNGLVEQTKRVGFTSYYALTEMGKEHAEHG